jgi:Tfp pilus assembly protein PilX
MKKPFRTPDSQRGATLIVGLVLLLVLTVLAVSTMSGATFGLTMVSNTQYSENAFQMADTGIDVSLAGGAWRNNPVTAIPATAVDDADGDQIGTYQANTAYQQNTPVPGGGNTEGLFEACHFQTVAIGTSARNASSQHTQEFYVICPGSGS